MKQLAKCMKIKLISHWFSKNKQNYYRNKVLGNICVPQTENKTDLRTALIRFTSTALLMSTMNNCTILIIISVNKYTLRKLQSPKFELWILSEHETYSLKMNLSVLLQYFFVINFLLLLFYFVFCILVCKCIQCPQRSEDDVEMEKEWQRVVSHHVGAMNGTCLFWQSSECS